MRVYKFLPCKWGCRALRDKRLKLSEFHKLNDPFEFRPFIFNRPEQASELAIKIYNFGKTNALSCFSASWHSPVIWAHYADNHQGLCLGFDVPDSKAKAVKYISAPYVPTKVDIEMVDRLLFTKYDHWKYEDEIRMFAHIDMQVGDHYFMNFSDDLIIREIVVGGKGNISCLRIKQHLGVGLADIPIIKARPSLDSFQMVKDDTWDLID